jgi:hypothetical protein
MLQQLLAAAYTLQEWADRLSVRAAEKPKLDQPPILSDQEIAEDRKPTRVVPVTPNTVTHPVARLDSVLPTEVQVVLERDTAPHAVRSAPELVAPVQDFSSLKQQSVAYCTEIPEKRAVETTEVNSAPLFWPRQRGRSRNKQLFLADELFWKLATVVAVTAVSALLLGASIHRFSPLPAGLSLPSDVAHQPVPFERTKHIVTLRAPTSSLGTREVAPELATVTKTSTRTMLTVVADLPPGSAVSLASVQKTIVKSHRRRIVRYSEPDIVAPDIVIHYGTSSAGHRLQGQKKPESGLAVSPAFDGAAR